MSGKADVEQLKTHLMRPQRNFSKGAYLRVAGSGICIVTRPVILRCQHLSSSSWTTDQADRDKHKLVKGNLELEKTSPAVSVGAGASSQVTSVPSGANALVLRRPINARDERVNRVVDGEVPRASDSGYVDGCGLRGIEQRVVRLLDSLNSQARDAKAQVGVLRLHMDEGCRLHEEVQEEAAEGHRWSDQVTHASARISCLTEELRALEMRMLTLQGTKQLVMHELDDLRRQRRLWQQKQAQHEETRTPRRRG
ncbi:hypothetical protein Efla_001331 [Eimeria flavescens]